MFFFVLEWFETSFRKFVLSLNGSRCEMVWNGISAFLYFMEWFGTKLRSSESFSLIWNGSERNSAHFYLPRNGWERNYEVPIVFLFYEMVRNGSPSIFIFHGMVRNGILSFFRSAKQTEFRQNESTSACSVFCGINFFSENGNPNLYQNHRHLPPASKTRRV